MDLRPSWASCNSCNSNLHAGEDEEWGARLADAIMGNNLPLVRSLLQSNRISPNFSPYLKSPMCYAATVGNTDMMKVLVDAGADINAPNLSDVHWERCPVHICASKGHLRALQFLVGHGADINQHDGDHRTPLHWVAMYGQAHMIKWMLQAGAAVNVTQTDGFTPLHTASCLGHADVCRLLVEGGADVSRRDRDGWTPLHTAVCYGYRNIVELLIGLGANPMVTTGGYDSCLHIAASKGFLDMMTVLLDKGVPLEGLNCSGATPLHIAVYYSYLQAAHFLVRRGADVNTKNFTGQSPVYLCVIRRDIEMLKLLLESGCFLTPEICAQMEKLPAALNSKRDTPSTSSGNISNAATPSANSHSNSRAATTSSSSSSSGSPSTASTSSPSGPYENLQTRNRTTSVHSGDIAVSPSNSQPVATESLSRTSENTASSSSARNTTPEVRAQTVTRNSWDRRPDVNPELGSDSDIDASRQTQADAAQQTVLSFVTTVSVGELEARSRSLTNLCLLSIRHLLAPGLQVKVRLLPVPDAVKRALALDALVLVPAADTRAGHKVAVMKFGSSISSKSVG